jgi:hypothetical protein
MTIDYKSMSNDELREVLTSAAAELRSRHDAARDDHSARHLYRITMRRTPTSEPQAFRFTLIEDCVVQFPLPLNQVIGQTGKVIGGEFWLDNGDVVRKVAASGQVRHFIARQGNLDDLHYDVSRVLEGETDFETAKKVEAFVRGDRTLLIRELEETIAHSNERAAECEEEGKEDSYWKRVAQDYRTRIPNLKAMLLWAQLTNGSRVTNCGHIDRDQSGGKDLPVGAEGRRVPR